MSSNINGLANSGGRLEILPGAQFKSIYIANDLKNENEINLDNHESESGSDNFESDDEEEKEEDDDDEYISDAQEEWEESIRQLQLLFSVILFPFIGKFFGRKFSYYLWARYLEYRYPVKVQTKSSTEFAVAGALAVGSTLT